MYTFSSLTCFARFGYIHLMFSLHDLLVHLLAYIVTLWFMDFREADESRLREVCESFLGPPTGMVEATLDSKNLAWDPFVLVRLLIQFVRCPLLFGYRPRTFSIVLSLSLWPY